MTASLSDLLLRVDGRWDILSHSCLVCWGGYFIPLCIYVVKNGGTEHVRRWIVSLESDKRDEAKSCISSGLDSIAKKQHDSGCNQLLSGLDQWRDSQNIVEKRTAVVKSTPLRGIVGIAVAGMAWTARMFEPSHSCISVVLALCSLLMFCLWILAGTLPLVFEASKHGFAVATDSGNSRERDTSKLNTGASAIEELRRLQDRWEDEDTIYGLKPLLREARFQLHSAVVNAPASEIHQYDDLMQRSQEIEKMPTSTEAEVDAFRGAGHSFWFEVNERVGVGKGAEWQIKT